MRARAPRRPVILRQVGSFFVMMLGKGGRFQGVFKRLPGNGKEVGAMVQFYDDAW